MVIVEQVFNTQEGGEDSVLLIASCRKDQLFLSGYVIEWFLPLLSFYLPFCLLFSRTFFVGPKLVCLLLRGFLQVSVLSGLSSFSSLSSLRLLTARIGIQLSS